jgi:hypothetical protein
LGSSKKNFAIFSLFIFLTTIMKAFVVGVLFLDADSGRSPSRDAAPVTRTSTRDWISAMVRMNFLACFY